MSKDGFTRDMYGGRELCYKRSPQCDHVNEDCNSISVESKT